MTSKRQALLGILALGMLGAMAANVKNKKVKQNLMEEFEKELEVVNEFELAEEVMELSELNEEELYEQLFDELEEEEEELKAEEEVDNDSIGE